MRYIVTGGAGYIGSRLVRRLAKRNSVIVRDEDIEKVGDLQKNAVYSGCDVCDTEKIRKIIKEYKPDGVVHLASYISVGESEERPTMYRENNVKSLLSIINVMREFDIDKLVFSSSAAVYGGSVYGETKRACERLLRERNISGNIKSISLRYFNVVGADPDKRHLIPAIMDSIRTGKEFELFGDDYDTRDGTALRDYVHVDDVVRATEMAMIELQKGKISNDVFDIGTGDGVSVKEIIEEVEEVTGQKVKVKYRPRRQGDVGKLVARPTIAKEVIGWKPEKTIREAIIEQVNNSSFQMVL